MSSRVAAKPSVPQELGYAQITSSAQQTGAGTSDAAGLSVTVTVGSRPIIVEVGGTTVNNSSASGVGTISLKEGATVLATFSSSLTTIPQPVSRAVRLTPTAGSHTYKVTIGQLVTGNTVLTASATDPAFIWVREV